MAGTVGLRLAQDAGGELVESLPIDGDATGAHFYRPGIARRKGARCDLAAIQDRQVSRRVHFDSSGMAGTAGLRLAQDAGGELVESLPIDGDATGAHFYLHSIPTRRSSDLDIAAVQDRQVSRCVHFDSSGM